MSLRDEPVLVLDAQATGASPAHGQLLELGWGWGSARDPELQTQAHLLSQPEGEGLPKIITRVTGITDAALAHARPMDAVWGELLAECAPRAPVRAVIHCARFELSFLQSRAEPLPFDVLCTLEVARRLLPGLPRRGLRALAGYFGLGIEQLRRAEDHVRATAFVWHHLAGLLEQAGVHSWEDAVALTHDAAPKRTRKEFPLAREKRLALPEQPGVYRLLRSNGDILYIGKATSLKRRVNSYFQKQSGRDERMLELLSQVRDLDVTPTATPLEAALLETDSIKLLEPPYNLALLGDVREPCFATRDLQHVSTEASDEHPVGPLPSRWRQRRYVGLCRLLAADHSPEAVTQAFGWTPEELPPEVLREGLEQFEERNPAAVVSPVAFRAAGTRRWNTQARKEDPGETREDDAPWDAARVLRNLEDTLVFFALELRRGVWLRRLSNATVVFDDGCVRTLVLRGGRVRSRHAGKRLRGVQPATPTFDIATYDRMRVLSTELRRIVQDGRSVSVQFAGGRELSPAAVARMLPWV